MESTAEFTEQRDVVQAESSLQRLTERAGLTEAGREMVVKMADPFHDREMRCQGVPDFRGSRTIVQEITRSARFSRPASVPATDRWSMAVYNLPVNQTTTSYRCNVSGQNVSIPLITTGTIGTCTVVTGPVDATFYPNSSRDIIVANTVTFGLSPTEFVGITEVPADQYTSGYHRLFAAGIEVYCTASDLYNGGDVCAFRQTTGHDEQYVVGSFAGPAGVIGTNGYITRGPPATFNDAITIPGSRRWRSKEGCYLPLMVNEPDIPFVYPTPQLIVPLGDSRTVGAGTAVTTRALVPIQGFPAQAPLTGPNLLSTNNFHTSGAIFDGLDPQGTYTVIAKFYIERMPSVSESDLVVLAQPSPPADEVAWRIYSEMVRTAPPGVPVRDNALGAWFATAVKSVAKELLPVLKKEGKGLAMDVLHDPEFRPAAAVARSAQRGRANRRKQSQA